jgi:hypothetical protein
MEKGIKERVKRLRWFAVADWQIRFQAPFLLGNTAEPLNSTNLRESLPKNRRSLQQNKLHARQNALGRDRSCRSTVQEYLAHASSCLV